MSTATYIHCHECDRGGNGSAKDKCACGWRVKHVSDKGCYLGSILKPVPKENEKPRVSKRRQAAKNRYMRYLEFGDGFRSFREFLGWDSHPDRSWNRRAIA